MQANKQRTGAERGGAGAHFPPDGAAAVHAIDDKQAAAIAQRAELVNDIWAIAAEVTVKQARRDAEGHAVAGEFEFVTINHDIMRKMIERRFEVNDGLDSLGFDELIKVRDGLKTKRDAQERGRKLYRAIRSAGVLSVLDEFIAFEFDGRSLGELTDDELNIVERAFADDLTAKA